VVTVTGNAGRRRLTIPRLVVAAPASGSGKTTVATGLMAAFASAGLEVSPHKVGPDYIDPGYHALAAGRPGRNLDAVLCGPGRIAPLFAHGAGARRGRRPADVAVVEGVMGLFDGATRRVAAGQEADHASTAHVARLLDAPVVLVVDASGAARSAAALVCGFRDFDPRLRLAGVILNRVGSARHAEILREALDEIGMPVFGALPEHDAVRNPSRHLGLVPAAERSAQASEAVRALGELVAASCDVAALVQTARSAPPLSVEPWAPAAAVADEKAAAVHRDPPDPGAEGAGQEGTAGGAGEAGDGAPGSGKDTPVKVAVAGGAAFTFGYAEHVELLEAAGAEVAVVDPLTDEALPAGADALVIGGGFPEEHAPALVANAALRADVAAFVRRGAPVVAECAGLLYLARTLDGRPMCGVLDADVVMGPRLTLGYRRAVAAADSPVAAAGTAVHAHEFHRTELVRTPATDDTSTGVRGADAGQRGDPARAGAAWLVDGRTEGVVAGRVHASYLHLHWAGSPSVPVRLVAAARPPHRRQDLRSSAK
jgi:cobyrinic acid a,c-diamide synthase